MKMHACLLRAASALAVALFCAGCDDGGFDHTPPSGQGSIVVDNDTLCDLLVYVDGRRVFTVSDYDHEIVDLPPGVYRVVVDEKGGYHSYRADTDVLQGQLTVLAVRGYYSGNEFDVRVYFE